jgi:hypothetical protein
MRGQVKNTMPMAAEIPVVPAITPEQEDRARRTVCANAVDAEEAEMMLNMLGLL